MNNENFPIYTLLLATVSVIDPYSLLPGGVLAITIIRPIIIQTLVATALVSFIYYRSRYFLLS